MSRAVVDTGSSHDVHSESGRTTQRKARSDAFRNRQRLLEAALQAFTARGGDVALEDIAREAGVGIATLYRNFPTRDDLIAAIYTNEIDRLCGEADRLLAALPPDQALAEWMQLFVQHVNTKRGMLAALKPMLSANATCFDEARACAVRSTTKLLEAGARAGTIRTDVDGGDLLRAMSGICMSTDEERPDVASRLIRLVFDGLRVVNQTAS